MKKTKTKQNKTNKTKHESACVIKNMTHRPILKETDAQSTGKLDRKPVSCKTLWESNRIKWLKKKKKKYKTTKISSVEWHFCGCFVLLLFFLGETFSTVPSIRFRCSIQRALKKGVDAILCLSGEGHGAETTESCECVDTNCRSSWDITESNPVIGLRFTCLIFSHSIWRAAISSTALIVNHKQSDVSCWVLIYGQTTCEQMNMLHGADWGGRRWHLVGKFHHLQLTVIAFLIKTNKKQGLIFHIVFFHISVSCCWQHCAPKPLSFSTRNERLIKNSCQVWEWSECFGSQKCRQIPKMQTDKMHTKKKSMKGHNHPLDACRSSRRLPVKKGTFGNDRSKSYDFC